LEPVLEGGHNRAWLQALAPVLALGGGYFVWSVAGALDKGPVARAGLAIAAVAALAVIWVIESSLLSRLLKLPFTVTAVRISLSWITLVLLPLSAPYFSHRVASSFFQGDPSSARVLALAVWLVGLAVAGSVVLKILLFRRRDGIPLAWLERHAVRVLWAGITVYFVVFVSLAFIAYARFRGYHSDLGEYNQTLWATLRGRFFYTTLEETSPDSYLSTHVSPFLLMLLPVYAIWQSPLAYLFLRSLALALSALPLFYCSRRITGSAAASLILAAAFLLHPEIVAQHFTSGYEVVFAAAFFFAAFYFFMEKRFGLFIFFLVMVLAVREDFIPAALVFSIYALIKKRRLRWVLTPLALFLVSEVAVNLIFSSTIEHYTFNLYYGHFGQSPGELARTVVSHPVYAFQEIWRYHASYLYNLMMPEGLFLPFAGAASLFAIPNLMFTLARGQDISAGAGGISHYSVLVVSAFWLGLAAFISFVRKRLIQSGESAGAALAPVFISVIIAVLVLGSVHLWSYYLPLSRPADADALNQAIEMVPPDASVSSNDGRALSHLSSRWEVYEPLLWDVPGPDRLPQGFEQLAAEYVLVKPFGNPYFDEAGAFEFLTTPGSPYLLIFEKDGIKLYRREAIGSS